MMPADLLLGIHKRVMDQVSVDIDHCRLMLDLSMNLKGGDECVMSVDEG